MAQCETLAQGFFYTPFTSSKDHHKISSEKSSDIKKSKNEHKERKSSEKSEKSKKTEKSEKSEKSEKDLVPDSVLSFLDAMDKIGECMKISVLRIAFRFFQESSFPLKMESWKDFIDSEKTPGNLSG